MPDLDTILQEFASFIENELPPPDVERLVGSAPVRPTRRHRWRPVVVLAAAALAVLVLGMPLLMFGVFSSTPIIEDRATTPTVPVRTPTTAAVTTTITDLGITPITVVPPVVPALSEGWEIVFSTRPGDTLFLESVLATDEGYYIRLLDAETSEINWQLATFGGSELTLVDVDVPASTESPSGFVAGGPGVVAWTNVGPESRTEAQLLVSSDSISFERVAQGLLADCDGAADCRGTEIYAAAVSPEGRVVALAYDPLVWDAECECFELNPVALVSDDGHEWTRHPIDLRNVLPPEWQGAADIRSPLVHVGGRWLTYATHYSNDCMCTDTALFASANGVDWQAVDTGDLFNETYLTGMAANDGGVVVTTYTHAYWSPDGIQWSRSVVTGDAMLQKTAAYDNGYVVVGSSMTDEGGSTDRIWYSADGMSWTQTALALEETSYWNALIGDGTNLLADGVTKSNLRAIWRWSE